MSVEWPAILPLPQFGLRYNVADPQMRTLMASGRTISRRRFSDVPTEFSARWILTQSQAEIFEQFYQNDAVDGTEWIEMPLVTAQGEAVNYVRFRGAYRYRRVGPGLWEYSADLQMYLRPGSAVTPPGTGGVPVPLDWLQIVGGLNSPVTGQTFFSSSLATDGNGRWIAASGTVSSGRGFKSVDAGESWEFFAGNFSLSTITTTSDYVHGIATDGDGKWIVCTGFSYFSMSIDNGDTWVEQSRFLGLPVIPEISYRAINNPRSIVCDGDGTWVVAGGLGIARSTDNAVTWEGILPDGGAGSPSHSLGVLATDRNGVWVVADRFHRRAFRSVDNAATWTALPTGLNSGITFGWFRDIATDGNGVWVIVSDTGHCARSVDNGATWSALPQGLNSGATSAQFEGICTDGFGRWIAVASNGFSSESVDNGETWSAGVANLNISATSSIVDFKACRYADGTWIALVNSEFASRRGSAE